MIKLAYIFNYIDPHAQRHGFRPKTQKKPFPRSEFMLALNLDTLDGRSPNAVRVHARTTQVDFEVDDLPPADSPRPGDLLITTVKETVILYKK